MRRTKYNPAARTHPAEILYRDAMSFSFRSTSSSSGRRYNFDATNRLSLYMSFMYQDDHVGFAGLCIHVMAYDRLSNFKC